ncbi:PEP-CTERM sorting domain-containing protein [Chamaesiphon sp. VAR_48_metabat_403]|uniref:PEP-CTERM sorting domain-containing protein n=1 Tax=Chamaesiphon sp. VAR_48_metabat_403 TaxID=2964700 RepID=UPI00286D7E35|nr:PEP-CTERM sorting domain-containing protein [Chamaesiphon sp. VAR_48_metabat_403]
MQTTFSTNLLQTAIASGIALASSILGFSFTDIAPAHAATLNYAGTTNPDGPTFQAITAFEPTTFSVFHFRVSTTDRYDFSSTSTGWQNAISLYRNVFNPSNNFTNLINSSTQNPDASGVSTSTFFVPSLAAGVDYFLVTSGLRSSDFGNFNNTISGAGDILPSTTTAVPEPFTIFGTLIGGTAALRMRKKLAVSKA